jgi:hypothetical protein
VPESRLPENNLKIAVHIYNIPLFESF